MSTKVSSSKGKYGKESEKKPYTKKKGKKPYSKEKDDKRESNIDSERTSSIGENDPKWYVTDEAVTDQATRISFSNFVGVPIDFNPGGYITGLQTNSFMPGSIMQVFLNPSPGYTTIGNAKNAAINQQGFRTYARLSSANAKTTNYTPNDVTTMILAMGELISTISFAQRAYGLIWSYNVRNRTMPGDLLASAGVEPNALRADSAKFLTELNTLIVEANKIPFPSNIDYFNKCAQIFSSVFADSASSMSELYVPIPFSTWDLDEAGSTQGTVLKTHTYWDGIGPDFEPMDPYDLLAIIRSKINTMLTSTTYNYIYSDILNLATKDSNVKLLQFVPIDFGYSVAPIYDTEWILMINNATIVGEPLLTADQYHSELHTNSNDVVPDVNKLSLLYAPQFGNSHPIIAIPKILNFYNDAPSMDERIIATRYLVTSNVVRFGPLKEKGESPTAGPITNYYYTDDDLSMGDHYVVGINLLGADTSIGYTYSSGDEFSSPTFIPSVLTRFSNHPYIYEIDTSVWPDVNIVGLVGDIDFYTTIDATTLARINKLLLFALFDVKDIINK